MDNAYELEFASASQVGKILTIYCKKGGEFMISFLPTSIMILPCLASEMYHDVMVEVPYENMPNIGYINPESELEGKTMRVKSQSSPVNPAASSGTVKLWAKMDEYKIIMNIKHIKGLVLSNKVNVIQVFDGVIQSPFTNESSFMITTIPNSWLLEVLKLITSKTQWWFACNMDGVSFIFADRILTYPEGIDMCYEENMMQTIDSQIIEILKKAVSCNKSGITKIRIVGLQCWFVIMLGDWGQCTIKMGNLSD